MGPMRLRPARPLTCPAHERKTDVSDLSDPSGPPDTQLGAPLPPLEAEDWRACLLTLGPVRLEPLSPAHREGLRAAGAEARIWRWMPIAARGARFDAWFDWSLGEAEAGRESVWAIRLRAGAGEEGPLAGSTRYLNISSRDRRAEIGHTWYHPSHWGGAVNPAAKYLLLAHGFERLGLTRMELKTDALNTRSQAAIAKLGAVREGVLRHHMHLPVRDEAGHETGKMRLRDTVMFGFTRADWERARAGLEARLAALGIAAGQSSDVG